MVELDEATARRRVRDSDVGFLATVDESEAPHLVPVVFAIESDLIWIAIDEKPKSSYDLKRMRNIMQNPKVALLAQHYESDWERLWWVRLDGEARILEKGPERRSAIQRLQAKYPQHQAQPPPGPVIEIKVKRWKGWAAGDRA